ncbi:MAG: hypothetical protein P4L55_22485 [Syntrophobacteraceae bacterium]|nr:hypothetical protein [Syntrophobacteraceae bacterium]
MNSLGNLTNWDKEDIPWKENTSTSICMGMSMLTRIPTSMLMTARRTPMNMDTNMSMSTCTNISTSTLTGRVGTSTIMSTPESMGIMTTTITAMRLNRTSTPTEIFSTRVIEFVR